MDRLFKLTVSTKVSRYFMVVSIAQHYIPNIIDILRAVTQCISGESTAKNELLFIKIVVLIFVIQFRGRYEMVLLYM